MDVSQMDCASSPVYFFLLIQRHDLKNKCVYRNSSQKPATICEKIDKIASKSMHSVATLADDSLRHVHQYGVIGMCEKKLCCDSAFSNKKSKIKHFEN